MYLRKAGVRVTYWALTSMLICAPALHSSYEQIRTCAASIIQDHPTMNIGIKAVSLTKGVEICSIHGDCRFTPASTTKLFTALLALEYLGPDYRFETALMTDGSIEGSVLHGSLYLKDAGDPSLTEAEIQTLIATLHNQYQIETITGNFYVDCTLFDDDIYQPGSFFDNVGYGWNPPTTALSVDGKAAYLKVPRGGALVPDEKLRAVVYTLTTALKTMLRTSGITLKGAIIRQSSPLEAQQLAIHQSEPISELLKCMMKESNNLYADCIFKTVGALYSGSTGSWKHGTDALTSLLIRMNIDPKEVCIMDGSGRSRYNLIAPAHSITALQWAHQQPYFPYLFESLSVAGIDGTLKGRMKGLGEYIRGKTGTLSGVSALCGYGTLPNDLIAFSIMVNGFVAPSAYNAPCKSGFEDAFCSCLAQEALVLLRNLA